MAEEENKKVNKHYYWLRLKENFFRQKEIKKLRKIAGGDTYTIIYLKMQLLTLTTGGVITFEGTEDNLAEQLELELDEDKDNIQLTINFLIKHGLIREVKEDEFLLPSVLQSIGKESASAERVRKHRQKKQLEEAEKSKALQCNTGVTKSNTEIEKEIEIKKDIDKDNNKEDYALLSLYEELGFGTINQIVLTDIEVLVNQYSNIWVFEAMKEANDQGKRTMKYVKGILKNWKTNGFKAEKPKKNYSKKESGTGFNNFEPRQYDYDSLEKKLLGWDDDNE